jgi:hypothetical protein
VRDELVAFIGRKFEAERGKKLKNLGPDVACVMESLAEAMAVLHVDVLRSLADGGGTDAYERKLELAKSMERGRPDGDGEKSPKK